jgi:hypothetical protein
VRLDATLAPMGADRCRARDIRCCHGAAEEQAQSAEGRARNHCRPRRLLARGLHADPGVGGGAIEPIGPTDVPSPHLTSTELDTPADPARPNAVQNAISHGDTNTHGQTNTQADTTTHGHADAVSATGGRRRRLTDR